MIYILLSFLLIVIGPMKLHWYIIVIQLFLEIPGHKPNKCLQQKPKPGQSTSLLFCDQFKYFLHLNESFAQTSAMDLRSICTAYVCCHYVCSSSLCGGGFIFW